MTKNIFDLHFEPMTLILKLDLDMAKMYPYAENEVPSFSSSKNYSLSRQTQTDRHTDRQIHRHRQTDRQTHAHTHTHTYTHTPE